MAHDLTIEILKQIRDELVTTRTTLGERIDRTNDRLSAVEVTLLDLAEQQRFMVRHLATLATRDRHLEADVDALRARVDKIEARLG